MGERQFEGVYNEGTIVSNRRSSIDLGNQKPTITDMDQYTDHTKFPEQAPVPISPAIQRICKCRFCREPGHDIKSCHPFHTNGEGIVQDDDPSRKFGHSIVYHFPHIPSDEYAGNTKMLAQPPRRELCSHSEYSTSRKAKDYLLDRKPDPVEVVVEGQSQYFPTISGKVITTTNKGKRKRTQPTKQSLEQRLLFLERLFEQRVPDCYSNNNTLSLVTIQELRLEIFRLKPLQKDVDLYKSTNKVLCHFLRQLRHDKRNDRTFTAAHDLILDLEILMPLSSANNKNCNDNAYSKVDQDYHREVIGENHLEEHSIVHHAMHVTSKGRSRIDTDTAIMDIVLAKYRTMMNSIKRSRGTITSGVIIGRNEPATTPQGSNQSTMFSPYGDSGQNASLNMCETQSQSPPPTDLEAETALGSMSLDLDVVVSQTNDNQDMSASQKIVKGVDAFQVDDKKQTRKNHSEVKEVSHDYLYCYHPFLQCMRVVLLGCINVIISFFVCH